MTVHTQSLQKDQKANSNVLLILKPILHDAVDDISLNILKRLNILVVKDVEHDKIEILSKSLGCKPISDIEAFTEDKLCYADLLEETSDSEVKVVRIMAFEIGSYIKYPRYREQQPGCRRMRTEFTRCSVRCSMAGVKMR